MAKYCTSPHQRVSEIASERKDGTDNAVQVHASVPANTFAVYGRGEDKELTELVPGILNQLGPDSLASLRKLAEQYQQMQGQAQAGAESKEDDDDIPDLVEKFDEQD